MPVACGIEAVSSAFDRARQTRLEPARPRRPSSRQYRRTRWRTGRIRRVGIRPPDRLGRSALRLGILVDGFAQIRSSGGSEPDTERLLRRSAPRRGLWRHSRLAVLYVIA